MYNDNLQYAKKNVRTSTTQQARAIEMIVTKKRLVNKHTKHSERHYALSMQLQNSSKARRQMKSELQQVKADAKMAEVPEETSTSTITKLNVALNPMEEEEDQVDTSRKTLSNNAKIVLDTNF